MTRYAPLAALAVLALGACSGETRKEAGAGNVEGEILPGSTSDAMLPFDQVKSQAPLAPKTEGGTKGDAKGADAAADSAGDGAAATEPAPSASPSEAPKTGE